MDMLEALRLARGGHRVRPACWREDTMRRACWVECRQVGTRWTYRMRDPGRDLPADLTLLWDGELLGEWEVVE